METIEVPEKLRGFRLISGAGDLDRHTLCVMTAVAYVAGLPHTDHPEESCGGSGAPPRPTSEARSAP